MVRRRRDSPTPRRDPVDTLSDEDGLRLGEMLRQAVRDQIRAKDPPEVGATYRRLLGEGHDKANAIELVTAVLAVEMYDIMNEGRNFDLAKYITHLRRLPELPYESDA